MIWCIEIWLLNYDELFYEFIMICCLDLRIVYYDEFVEFVDVFEFGVIV